MSYFFTTIIGVVVGAAIVLVAKAEWKKSELPHQSPAMTAPPSEDRGALEREAMQKQIENFLNYDGTANGQVSIGDDE